VPVPFGFDSSRVRNHSCWRLRRTNLCGGKTRRFGHYLLARDSLDETREHAYFIVYAPRTNVARQMLVNVAGRRWEIEE